MEKRLQSERYSRHILLQEIGAEGQEKINNGKVLVIGAGGLGSPMLLYLAAAGVGTLGVIDSDVVELSNLQRQVLHFTPDVGKPKIESAKEKIEKINPNVKVIAYNKFFTADNAFEIIKDYDFIVDCTDGFSVKFLINDACVLAGKPFSHGAMLRFDGETMTYNKDTACYRCVFHAPPPPGTMPTSLQVGILGVVPGMLATIQAAEVLKFLTGTGELLTNRLLTFDAKAMSFSTVNVKRNSKCPVCGDHPTITELVEV